MFFIFLSVLPHSLSHSTLVSSWQHIRTLIKIAKVISRFYENVYVMEEWQDIINRQRWRKRTTNKWNDDVSHWRKWPAFESRAGISNQLDKSLFIEHIPMMSLGPNLHTHWTCVPGTNRHITATLWYLSSVSCTLSALILNEFHLYPK